MFARLVAVVLLTGVLALGPATQAQDQAQDEIVLGMSAAFTGASADLGTQLYRGAQAYFAEVNDSGGIRGRRVRILPRDDGYDPVQAIHNTIEFIETDGVPLLFGYVGTPTVTRVLPLLKRYENRGPYLLFPFTGAEPQRQLPYGDFVFNLRASYVQETTALVDRFVDIGRTRIAVFYQADAYGRSGWDGVRKALDAHGLSIVAEATYTRGTTYQASMAAQVEAIRTADPDAIVSVGAYAACAAFVRDVVDAGWNVPIANLSFVGSESLLELLRTEGQRTGRDYASRLINSQVVPSYEDQSLVSVREFRTLVARHRPRAPFETGPGPERPSLTFVSFEGFLDAKLLTEVLRRSDGDVSRAGIRRAFVGIEALDLGIDVPLSFGPSRNQGLDTVYFTRVSGDRFVPLNDWRSWAR